MSLEGGPVERRRSHSSKREREGGETPGVKRRGKERKKRAPFRFRGHDGADKRA